MKLVRVGVFLLSVGVIALATVEIVKARSFRLGRIKTDGKPGDYSFEDEWDSDIDSR